MLHKTDRLFAAATLFFLSALMAPSQAADTSQGSRLYAKHCVRCHGANGSATFPGVPDFRRSNNLFKSDQVLVQTVLNGSGMMPAFNGILEEKDILDVIAYLRMISQR
ncbi:MAG: cytochrome c [Gammaproteobacteria bacterium]|nr:MAG: cytochrome c [Gammaproteobacteria bacterium]